MLQYTCIHTEGKAYTISLCCTHIKRDQPLVTILLNSPFEGFSPQSEVLVCRQESQLYAPKQTGSLYRGMRLICTNTQTVGLLNRLRLKCDGTRAETRFRLSAKRTSPFK